MSMGAPVSTATTICSPMDSMAWREVKEKIRTSPVGRMSGSEKQRLFIFGAGKLHQVGENMGKAVRNFKSVVEKEKIGVTQKNLERFQKRVKSRRSLNPSLFELLLKLKGTSVEVLFYLTSFDYSTDMGGQNVNYTPSVLERRILKGWGKNYYEQRLPNPKTPKEQK
jgi:hypothetical protein